MAMDNIKTDTIFENITVTPKPLNTNRQIEQKLLYANVLRIFARECIISSDTKLSDLVARTRTKVASYCIHYVSGDDSSPQVIML